MSRRLSQKGRFRSRKGIQEGRGVHRIRMKLLQEFHQGDRGSLGDRQGQAVMRRHHRAWIQSRAVAHSVHYDAVKRGKGRCLAPSTFRLFKKDSVRTRRDTRERQTASRDGRRPGEHHTDAQGARRRRVRTVRTARTSDARLWAGFGKG